MCLDKITKKTNLPKKMTCYVCVKKSNFRLLTSTEKKGLKPGMTIYDGTDGSKKGKIVRLNNGKLRRGGQWLIKRDDHQGHDASGHGPDKKLTYWWINIPTVKTKAFNATVYQGYPIIIGKRATLPMSHCLSVQKRECNKYPMGFHRWMTIKGAKKCVSAQQHIIEGTMENLIAIGKQEGQDVVVGRTFTPLRRLSEEELCQ